MKKFFPKTSIAGTKSYNKEIIKVLAPVIIVNAVMIAALIYVNKKFANDTYLD